MKFADSESTTSPHLNLSAKKGQHVLSESPQKEANGNLRHSEGLPKKPSVGKPRRRSKLLFVGLPMLATIVILFLFLPAIRKSLFGNVVCELDSSVFEDKHREQRITITKSEGELKKSRTKVIEVGVQIYERQKIISFPDYT